MEFKKNDTIRPKADALHPLLTVETVGKDASGCLSITAYWVGSNGERRYWVGRVSDAELISHATR